MNNIIKYGSIAAIPLYNCSAHTPEEWSAKDGVERPIAGILEMTYGTVVNLLYIPMISVMMEKEQFKMSCFKIMSFLTLIDIFALTVNSIITGFLSYHGAVYCTYPNLIYISGMAGLGLWCCSCIIAMSLVTNRLLDLLCPSVGAFLFDGNRTFLVLTLPIIYGIYFVFFTTPIAFSSKYMTWFFDPLIFPGRGLEYSNFPHFFNNILVVFFTCCLYMIFCCALGAKLKNVDAGSAAQKASTKIFYQSAMICAVNQVASVIYVSMNFIDVPFWLIVLGHVLWEMGHGAPAVIYLNFNMTIRNGVLRKLGFKKAKIGQSTTNHSRSHNVNRCFHHGSVGATSFDLLEMNNIIKYGSIAAIPQYNCSAYTPEEWSAKEGVQRPISGIVEIACGTIICALYIPMISVMMETEQFKMSCFKIMSFLAFIDIFALIITSILTGFLSYQGAVYCTYPTLIYISGMAGLGLWCCSCVIAMCLLINRLLELNFPSVGAFLFDGNRTFLVLNLPIIYGTYFVMFTTPVLFSSKYMAWFFDPFIFEGRKQDYANYSHLFNNTLNAFLTLCLYMIFCCALGAKLKNVDTGSPAQKSSTNVFYQSAMICVINQGASLIYVSMNFIEFPVWLIVTGHVFWELGHGAPAIIYLIFNKTIMNGVLRKLGFKKKTKVGLSSTTHSIWIRKASTIH